MELMFWVIFFVIVLGLIAIDLRATKGRGAHEMSFGTSIIWTLIWIIAALSFNFVVYWVYEYDLSSLRGDITGGKEAALLFFTGYLIEKSLSLDNIFVIALIFSYFRVPHQYQHRVLIWGVFGAIVMRFVMIFLGVVLIAKFSWITLIFGVLLIATAVKMLFLKEESVHPEKNIAVRLAKKCFPLTHEYHEDAFFIRKEGRLWMTPLFLALIVVETTDLIFAIDSIPAIFAITTDPFIVFTSNIFAILGLRSLYFVLVAAIRRFYYLRFSLIALLGFIGVKMLLIHYYPIDPKVSLSVILGILTLGVLPTIASPDGRLAIWALPIYEQFKELVFLTAKDLRRVIVLVLGGTILLIGIILLVLPGPGLLFIMLGLVLLAKEFIIARRLLKKLKKSNEQLQSYFRDETKSK